eukprot:s2775_g3.t1
MALSIGKQVAKGRTFIWEHGKKPYVALDHRRCRVWCPIDNRYYARRVQNNVSIFAVEDTRQPKQLMCASDYSKDLCQPALSAAAEEQAFFCGSRMERVHACICSVNDVNESFDVTRTALARVCDSSAPSEPEREHASSLQGCPGSLVDKGHVKRKHRKDNRQLRWEKKKSAADLFDSLKEHVHKSVHGVDA